MFHKKKGFIPVSLLLLLVITRAGQAYSRPLTADEPSTFTGETITETTEVTESDEEDEGDDYAGDNDNGGIDAFPIEPPESFFSFLDTPQRSISKGIYSIAAGIDGFFANEKIYYESSGSYIKLTADATWNEAGEIGYDSDVRIKLRFPVTQKKLKLLIESDPNEKKDPLDTALEETPLEAADKSEYYAGVQTTLGRPKEWSFRPSLGIKIRTPPDYYVRYRASRTYALGEWEMRLNETLYWFDSSGSGIDSALDLDYFLNEDFLFRSSSFARYTNENKYFDLSQVFTLFQTLSERRAVSYQAGVYGLSEPTVFASSYLVTMKYRQNVHADYLFAEIVPQILYRKDNDFHAEHSITFRLEMVFGG